MRFSTRAVLVLLASLLLAPAVSSFQKSPDPSGADRKITAQGRAEDLAAFRRDFLAKDKSYSPAARAEAEKRLAALEGASATISEPNFELELARIVALADNGHTHYVLSSISRYYNRVPIRLGTFGQDFFVLRAIDANADLLGARLLAIDGRPLEQLRAAGRELWGGPTALRDHFAFNLFESPELLHASGLASTSNAATYTFETATGAKVDRKLEGEAASTARPFAELAQVMFPQRLPLEDDHWRTALAPDHAPWSLLAWPIRFRWRKAPEMNGIVLELRQNADANGFKISQALKTFEKAIKSEKPTNIVVDMRVNDGGDLNTTRDFMESLPKLVSGRIFVLTSPYTFSAAISSVGYLKQAAPRRVTIVGESVGDRMVFFAEGRGASLPNSRGMIGLATQRHDYANGCRAVKDCQSSVVHHPIAVPSLTPEIAAPWTIEAYLAGRDPGMEAVAAALH